jgi:hypothetical protein
MTPLYAAVELHTVEIPGAKTAEEIDEPTEHD